MFGCVLRKYYTLRCKIDGETEYVGPCIVPGNVQIKFAPRNLLEINVRCNQSLAPFERPGVHFSEGRDDHAATTDQSSVGGVPLHWLEISRAVCAREILAGTNYEASSFIRDVAHAHPPHLPLVHRGRTPDLYPSAVQVLAVHRHVVLPADCRTQSADSRIHERQSGTVPKAPDKT